MTWHDDPDCGPPHGPPWRHGHHGHWRHHRGPGMRLRIFLGFTAAIFLTWLTVGAIFWIFGPSWRAGEHVAPRPWVKVMLLVAPLAVVWGLAGLWARRLARPLRELTQVARDLGDGKLERRARLRHDVRGEVGELTHAVNDMATRIEKQLRDQRELLAAVSHELRTPLARVRVLVEMGREGSARDVWGDVEAEVVEMDRLVGDLLASARLDFAALSARPLDAAEAARRALDRAALPDARLDAPGAPLEVSADATLLARALAALLDNARKHGGSHIVLRVAPRDGHVAFEVDDDGPGFAEEDLPHIFDAFYRAKREGSADGLGLGLSIVRRIAEAHRGRAHAQNLHPGARITLELPALERNERKE